MVADIAPQHPSERSVIGPLRVEDIGFALASWREAHKTSTRALDAVPWAYYKGLWGAKFAAILKDPCNVVLGAYDGATLLGWIAVSPGQRIYTLHWVHVSYERGGQRIRRHGLMTALMSAAGLGSRFIYTCQGGMLGRPMELPDGTIARRTDEVLVDALQRRGVTAVYEPLKQWLE